MLNSIKYLRFQSFKKSLSLSYDIDLFVAVKLSHCYVWNTCIIMVHILQSFCNDSDMSISLSLFIIYLFIHYLCIIKNLVILPTNDTCVGHHIFRNWGRSRPKSRSFIWTWGYKDAARVCVEYFGIVWWQISYIKINFLLH